MKKLYFLFIAVIALTSCSTDNSNNDPVAPTIDKVIFYRNSPNARQWNFNNDNLLNDITLADGSLAEKFFYDSEGRVTRDVIYTDGVVTDSYDITYNTDDTINSINGLEYNYDAATRTYSYTYSGSFSLVCKVNADLLAVDYSRTDTNTQDYHFVYANGNMTSFEKSVNGTTAAVKNFRFTTPFGANPIANGILAVARVKSLLDPEFLTDSQVSETIPLGYDCGATDPYFYSYGFVPGDNYLSVGIEVLDSNNNDVTFIQYAEYYYQN